MRHASSRPCRDVVALLFVCFSVPGPAEVATVRDGRCSRSSLADHRNAIRSPDRSQAIMVSSHVVDMDHPELLPGSDRRGIA